MVKTAGEGDIEVAKSLLRVVDIELGHRYDLSMQDERWPKCRWVVLLMRDGVERQVNLSYAGFQLNFQTSFFTYAQT